MPARQPESILLSPVRRDLGVSEYAHTRAQMIAFTQQRDNTTADEFWFLQHPPVYTLGLNGKRHHLLHDTAIAVVPTDRGGQITYHGPGQLVTYLLVDIDRLHLGIKDFVFRIEQALIQLLHNYDIAAERLAGAPGIYVEGAKIAALGLRVKQGRTYHGLALNVDMDLEPFSHINPCGYRNMPVTQLKDWLAHSRVLDIEQVSNELYSSLCVELGYNPPDQL
jgi:lipoyl(octanoyl) transferase